MSPNAQETAGTEQEWDFEAIAAEALAEPGEAGQPAGPSADPTPPASQAPAAAGPASPADATADTPEVQPESGPAPAAPAEEAPTPSDDPQQQQPQPFTFRVDGAEVQVPGAVRHDGYVAIPEAEWARVVQPRLADRNAWRAAERGFRQHIRELQDTRTRAEQQAAAFTQQIERLLENPDAFHAFMTDFERQAPLLKAQVERETLARENEALRRGTHQRALAEREAEEGPVRLQYLGHYVQEALAAPDFAGLGIAPEDVVEALRDHPNAFVVAQEDDPESGIRRGEVAVNLELIQRHLGVLAKPLRATHARLEQERRASAAAKANAAAVSGSRNAPPPAVPSAGAPVPAAPATTPKSYEDWRESFQTFDPLADD